jgi:hypothetical protein
MYSRALVAVVADRGGAAIEFSQDKDDRPETAVNDRGYIRARAARDYCGSINTYPRFSTASNVRIDLMSAAAGTHIQSTRAGLTSSIRNESDAAS